MKRRRVRHDPHAQLQLLESILVAVFIFIAIAVVSIYRLPTNPGTFQVAELENVALDALKVRQAKIPTAGDACHESPCPFEGDLDRMLSIALGYRGPHRLAGESPTDSELRNFLDQALPTGSRYIVLVGNGYNTTQLTPLGLSPPASDVVVARTVIGPNWTVHANNMTNGTSVRLGELTGWPALENLYDPLNRNETSTGAPLAPLFASRVPLNATFGTYRACTSTTCTNVTVVPPFQSGPGSQVLDLDDEVPRNPTPYGSWASTVKYRDIEGPGSLGVGDALYVDLDGNGQVTRGDLRLTRLADCRAGVPCPSGSTVRWEDPDNNSALLALPSTALRFDATTGYVEGTALYVDADGDQAVSVGDFRVTRVGVHESGSNVRAGDADVSGAIAGSFDGSQCWVAWDDAAAGGARGEGEPVFLNLTGNGQTGALERLDLHLSRDGVPPQRHTYEVRLVVWYGV